MIYYCTLRECPNLAGDSGYLILIWLLISQNSIGITAPTGHIVVKWYMVARRSFFRGGILWPWIVFMSKS